MRKSKLIYVLLENGEKLYPVGYVVHSWDEFHWLTFSPLVKWTRIIDFSRLPGKTYADKKDNLREMAIDFQHTDEGGLSYGELLEIQDFFERYGRRFGLLREFRENGIC